MTPLLAALRTAAQPRATGVPDALLYLLSGLFVLALGWAVLERRRRIAAAGGDGAIAPTWPEAFAVFGAEHRIALANEELATLLGRGIDQLVGTPFSELVFPQDWPEFQRSALAVASGELEQDRCRLRLHADEGGMVVVSAQLRLGPGDDGARILAKFFDETESWRTSTQLRLTERALHTASCGVVICDALEGDTPIVYVNSAFRKLTGYSVAEVLGQNCRFLNEADRAQPALDELRSALAERRESTVVLKNHRKDGSEFWNELTISPITDEAGTVTHWVGFLYDVSEQMELDAERERLLAQSIAAKRDADHAANARDTLLAIVSHELRSPLNSMRLWTTILGSESEPDRELIARALQHIEGGIEAQSRLIEDLLDASRFETGRIEMHREPVDFAKLVRDVVQSEQPFMDEKGIEFELVGEFGELSLRGDEDRLRQVVQNLVQNARKFTSRGGRVEVRVEPRGESVLLAVRDDGEGIEASYLPHVFDRFSQRDARDSRRYGGIGLGLSIVRHIVEHHGGAVRADSEGEGRGATFTVELPLDATGSRPSPRGRPAPALDAERAVGDVLVVDDDASTAEALSLGLHLRGYGVRVAENGKEALRLVRERRPALIISDLMMPEVTGFEFLRAVREEEFERELPRVPAIAISGRGSPSDARRIRLAGFDAYLKKPVRLKELQRRMDRFLSSPHETVSLRVLVADGDREFGEKLRTSLVSFGHDVIVAGSTAEALVHDSSEPVDVLLTAAELEDGRGSTLVQRFSEEHDRVLTVLLSDQEVDSASEGRAADLELSRASSSRDLARELSIWGRSPDVVASS